MIFPEPEHPDNLALHTIAIALDGCALSSEEILSTRIDLDSAIHMAEHRAMNRIRQYPFLVAALNPMMTLWIDGLAFGIDFARRMRAGMEAVELPEL